MEIINKSDVFKHNSSAWDREVSSGNPWTRPVSSEEVAKARRGEFCLILTPTKPVPDAWLLPVRGRDILCLASGGGQQGPLLAAAGARVTVLDSSPKQLDQDRMVAERDGLTLTTCLGDMRDLGCFADGSFDLIVHPVSNCFIPDVLPVWKEAFRVLRTEGSLLSGFNNPLLYSFDKQLYEKAIFQLKYPIPYSDLTSIGGEEQQKLIEQNAPLEFGHSLANQIGGQIDAGFHIAGFYEDVWGNNSAEDKLYNSFIATRAIKHGVNEGRDGGRCLLSS